MPDSSERAQSYDYTERLTFFVLSIEAAFCGYSLQVAKDVRPDAHLPALFLASGLAFVFGVLWRTTYNEVFHANAHFGRRPAWLARINWLLYYGFVLSTAIFLGGVLIVGTRYISRAQS